MPVELPQDLVVVQLPRQLQQLGRLVVLMGWGAPLRLPPLVALWHVALDDILGDVVNHGPLVDEVGGVKNAII